jgi:hypothetical protein
MPMKRYVIGLRTFGIARGDEPMLRIETQTSPRWRNARVAMAVLTVALLASGAHGALAGETNGASDANLGACSELTDVKRLLTSIDRDVSDALVAVSLAREEAAVASDPFERESVPGGIGGY